MLRLRAGSAFAHPQVPVKIGKRIGVDLNAGPRADQGGLMIVTGTHDPYLVALSILVACFASYTALDLGGRIGAASGYARGVWLLAAAVTMGGGIWSMHFIAMLAFVMPIPVSYDIGLTTLSVAMAVTGIGFHVISRRSATALCLVLSGAFMGHLGCERLKQAANIDIVHVPYKGATAALVDLLAGRVHLTFSVPTAVANVKSGELRALAVTGDKRLAALSDIPTVAEAGLPELEFGSWNGVHVPVGTPKPIIDKLNGAIGRARNLPDVQNRMVEVGLTPEGGTPAEFGEFVKRDIARWGKIVKETGVKMD